MKNILVALDLSDTSPAVLEQARVFGRELAAKLWLVHVAAPEPDFVGYDAGPQVERDAVADELHAEHREIQALAEGLRGEGFECTALLVQGATAAAILKQAEQLGVDLIIVGSHGRGPVKQLFVGSTSDGIVRQATVPVLVVPPRLGESG